MLMFEKLRKGIYLFQSTFMHHIQERRFPVCVYQLRENSGADVSVAAKRQDFQTLVFAYRRDDIEQEQQRGHCARRPTAGHGYELLEDFLVKISNGGCCVLQMFC